MTPEINFNPHDVPEETIPAGRYRVAATASELRTNLNQNGDYFYFTFQVLDGPHENHVFDLVIVRSHEESQKAVKNGRRRLADLCLACGKDRITRTEELHGIPVEAEVTVQPHETYGPSNRVATFRRLIQDDNPFDGHGGSETIDPRSDDTESEWPTA